jgi:ABC-type nitrate/sulfonate/bicarbonate transport system substrate-binding protein
MLQQFIRSSSPSGVASPVVRIGFKPLNDAAPLLVAIRQNLFAKYGVSVRLSCEVGWANIREKLFYGQVDAVHAIAGLSLAMRMGVSGPACKVVAPFVFNLHGDAITLSRDLWNRGVSDATSLRKLIRSSLNKKLTFGTVSRFSSHNFLLRSWLKSGGINPEEDVRIVVLPPTQMVGCIEAGLIHGCCVGEPWNSLAVEKGLGFIAGLSQHIAPQHPEKVLLTTESFLQSNGDAMAAVMEALREACIFCDEPSNRNEVARTLSLSGYFRTEERIIRKSLIGPMDLGTGEQLDASDFYLFHRQQANEPTLQRGAWMLEQFIQHGLISEAQRSDAERALQACWTNPFLTRRKSASKTVRRQKPSLAIA